MIELSPAVVASRTGATGIADVEVSALAAPPLTVTETISASDAVHATVARRASRPRGSLIPEMYDATARLRQ